MKYLIDTNIISEIMRKEPDPAVLHWFSGLNHIFMSVITLDEVSFGLKRKNLVKKYTWFMQFCEDKATFLEINEPISRWSGEKRAELENRGLHITMADSLIAATAYEHSLILATRNIKDFENTGIAVFNPFSA